MLTAFKSDINLKVDIKIGCDLHTHSFSFLNFKIVKGRQAVKMIKDFSLANFGELTSIAVE